MQQVKIELDKTKLDLDEYNNNKSIQEIFCSVIDNLLLLYSAQKKGFNEKERRQYYKILDMLDNIRNTKKDIVKLEDSEFNLLLECIKNGNFVPSKIFRQIENILNSAENIEI